LTGNFEDPNLVDALSEQKEGSRAFLLFREIDGQIKRGLADTLDQRSNIDAISRQNLPPGGELARSLPSVKASLGKLQKKRHLFGSVEPVKPYI